MNKEQIEKIRKIRNDRNIKNLAAGKNQNKGCFPSYILPRDIARQSASNPKEILFMNGQLIILTVYYMFVGWFGGMSD